MIYKISRDSSKIIELLLSNKNVNMSFYRRNEYTTGLAAAYLSSTNPKLNI